MTSDIRLSVYPNPTNGLFNVQFDGLNGENVLLTITDAQGRSVVDRQLNGVFGSSLEEINLNQVEGGMYYLTVVANGYRTTTKIIKH